MRFIVAAIVALLCAAPAASATDIEGYHDPGDRIACIMVKSAAGATAVRCGSKGRSQGLLLSSSGAARRVAWAWPNEKPDINFYAIKYGTTYYLYGGTAKLEGDSSTLRCTFSRRPSVRVRCRNGDGHAIEVTRTKLRRS